MINGISKFQAVLDKGRAHIEQGRHPFSYFTISEVKPGGTVGIYIHRRGGHHSDRIAYLNQDLISYPGGNQVLCGMPRGVSCTSVHFTGVFSTESTSPMGLLFPRRYPR